MGSYTNKEEAIRVYNNAVLIYHGLKAKTNFDYIEEEIDNIVSTDKKKLIDNMIITKKFYDSLSPRI